MCLRPVNRNGFWRQHILFDALGTAVGIVEIGLGNNALVEQFSRSFLFGLRKCKVGDERFPIVFRGGYLVGFRLVLHFFQ